MGIEMNSDLFSVHNMTMPIDLILVRHGESEGNRFNSDSKKKSGRKFAHLDQTFRKRHSSTWHLTRCGVRQAKFAGQVLRDVFPDPPHIDQYYTSDFLRAYETAAYLGFEGAKWRRTSRLIERDWGELEGLPHEERMGRFADAMARHEREGVYWRPDGGERLVSLAQPIFWMFDTLHRECSNKRVIMVCHGEFMHMFRILLERVPPEEYPSWYAPDSRDWKIPNGGMMHYTRRDPETGVKAPYMNWARSFIPDRTLSSASAWTPWRRIIRKLYSNADLLAIAAQYPRDIA